MTPQPNWPFGQDPTAAWQNMFDQWSKPDWNPWQAAQAQSMGSDPLKQMQDLLGKWISSMPGAASAQAGVWPPSPEALFDPLNKVWEQWSGAFSDAATSAGVRSPAHAWREALTMQPAPLGANRESVRQMQDHAATNAEMMQAVQAMQEALAPFAEKLQQALTVRTQQLQQEGKTLDSLRSMMDFWIDAAEDAYAEVAHSPAFGAALGRFTNAFTRLKQQRQKMLDQQLEVIGLPTRAEMQTSHERLQSARRDIRALKREIAALRSELGREGASGEAAGAQRNAVPAARKATAKKAAAKKVAAKKGAARKASAATSKKGKRASSKRAAGRNKE